MGCFVLDKNRDLLRKLNLQYIEIVEETESILFILENNIFFKSKNSLSGELKFSKRNKGNQEGIRKENYKPIEI